MSAQPAEPHPIGYDPDEILARLPERYRPAFLADYRAAMVAAAHETWRWHDLTKTLRLWHLRSLTYSASGYEQARADAAAGVPGVPVEQVIPEWAKLASQAE
ncbi:DUF6247 family protein [Thermostaphylospora chromogena]|uniref:Uncharacterized protein n=1 Tax=Thermostaphylospora chromogena TaxID=35622 RepID=A0A1H0XKE1_9ACTN|nr:DUF6247 family protein [Thermostaphylospora chromogena]SDQ03156.1 hypothetical protein SAMN04489764_0011 [Thermostaphylospora chromogena]SDQ03265.1 hypothetical protein SAMN04489764_0034 [Thermostaphylospora chromogena]SDQ03428.1 hypothetical protein SAMN04489764_0060 [Thermostaphylospora chromogena]